MKNFKQLALVASILMSIVACGDDDGGTTAPGGSTSPTSPTGTTSTSLTGKWSAYEFKGDDGVIYGLNQFIPYYDSNAVTGCVIRDYEEKIIEQSYTFSADSIVSFTINTIDRSRNYTVNNAATCDFTYDAWVEAPYNFTDEFIYNKLGNNKLIVWERGMQNQKDTIDYTLANGILFFNDDPDVKLRK